MEERQGQAGRKTIASATRRNSTKPSDLVRRPTARPTVAGTSTASPVFVRKSGGSKEREGKEKSERASVSESPIADNVKVRKSPSPEREQHCSPSGEGDFRTFLPPVRGSTIVMDASKQSPQTRAIRSRERSRERAETAHHNSFNAKSNKDRQVTKLGGSDGRRGSDEMEEEGFVLNVSPGKAERNKAERKVLLEPPTFMESDDAGNGIQGSPIFDVMAPFVYVAVPGEPQGAQAPVRKDARISMFADHLTCALSSDRAAADRGPACCQWTIPLSQNSYFEVVVIALDGVGGVCVGVASKSAGLKGRFACSGGLHRAYGYFSRDGSVFVGSPTEDSKTMAFSVGDVVGCGYTEGKGTQFTCFTCTKGPNTDAEGVARLTSSAPKTAAPSRFFLARSPRSACCVSICTFVLAKRVN
jgi:hypothetical protein